MSASLRGRTAFLFGLLVVVGLAAAWLGWQRHGFGARTEAPATAGDHQLFARSEFTVVDHPRVSDEAGVLAPFGARLGRMADAFDDDLGIDVHVVTTQEKAGTIELQAERKFGERAIGRTAATGGVLILLNPMLRSARIEVGYSLEGGLTDLHMGRIARDQLAPYVSYASAGMAVMDVLHYLRNQVYAAAARGNIALGEEYRRTRAFTQVSRFLSGGAGARTALSDVPVDADLKRTLSGSRRARYAPSADVRESVAALLRATADLAGDPTLELFTEGSRLMRAHYPLAPFEELQRLERIDASLPLEYHVRGDYAVASSRRPANGFVPILLHREGGLWRIDLVETWKNLFFDSEGNYLLANANTPYAFGLVQFGEARAFDIAALPLGSESIAGALARLKERNDVLSTLRRAEIWLRNAFVFPTALVAYEEAIHKAPEDPLVLQTFADRALYLGFPELAIPALEKIGSGVELMLAEAYHLQGDENRARLWTERALRENPFDWYALHWRKRLAERYGTEEEAKLAAAQIAELAADRAGRVHPVELRFEPARPKFHADTTIQSDGVTVFDHSEFRVTMQNTSYRPIVIDSIRLTSAGTAARSGLGDVRDYWRYPAGGRSLRPGESVHFDKLWGFTVDTGHEHVRYVFHACWRGAGEDVRQCRTQWVDVLP